MASFDLDMELREDITNTLCEVIFSSKWKLLCGLSVDGVEILKRGVFALHCAPDLVFKVSNDPSGFDLEHRWSNVKRVAEILKDSQFNLLVLPRQTLIRLRINEEKHIVIVEKRLPLTNNLLIHKGLYESLGARLEPALRQLVAFIITSGFYGVDFRHVPILMAPGPIPTIGLVDVSECGDVSKCGDVWGDAAQQTHENAFFAKDQENVRGLFGCIHPDQFPVVRDEALKCQVTFDEGDYYEALKDRCRDLEEAHRNLKLVRDEEAYENRAKNIFKTVSEALSVAIPSTLEAITNSLNAFDEEQQLFMAPRWFMVWSIDQPDLILCGIMILDPKTRSLAALSMSIQGSIASSLADTTSLRGPLDEFCCSLMNREHTPEKRKILLEKLPDEQGLFYSILADYMYRLNEEDGNLPAVRRLQDVGYLHQHTGSLLRSVVDGYM